MTKDELYQLLDERSACPGRAGEIDAEIWSRSGAERAVLVCDLSGFTRITRAHGILHFLGGYRDVVRAAIPLFDQHGVQFWKSEADNLLATFSELDEALAVGRALARRDGEVRACVGIGYGSILELEDDIFGDEVNVAFKLGEDQAGPGEVLVSEAASLRMTTADFEGPLRCPVSGLELTYFRWRGPL